MYIFILYLFSVNVLTFIIYGIDKQKAKMNKWRIPEKSLLLLAFVGGSVGAWMGMQMFRHKTRKPAFMYGIPVILLCQMGLYTYFFIK